MSWRVNLISLVELGAEWLRFVKYKEEVLRFCTDFTVPFTNNLAERDLRMIKVKEKISGTFASFKGGEIFARIRGYISTVKKNNRSVLEELSNVLKGKPYIPCGVGCWMITIYETKFLLIIF